MTVIDPSAPSSQNPVVERTTRKGVTRGAVTQIMRAACEMRSPAMGMPDVGLAKGSGLHEE